MIGFVVLNYKNYEATLRCVSSIEKNPSDSEYHIFIVDNGSANESINIFKEAYKNDEKVSIYELKDNYGFAVGNNFGIQQCDNQGITKAILTNSDIIFYKNTATQLVKDLENNSAVIVGPRILRGGLHNILRGLEEAA